jgi:ABC-2 type transport system permease protein
MSLWRLEVLRLARTRRWIALLSVYVFFGFLGPVTARYIEDIVSFAGGNTSGATIKFAPPIPADGMAQYVSNAVQIGTLVTVIVAAGALAFDSQPEMGVFLRSRVKRMSNILLPRLVVPFLAASAAFVLGAIAAWYETWALIGGLDAGRVLLGVAFGVVFIAFVVALVAAVAQWSRGLLATVLTSVVVLLVMPVLGIAGAVGRWLPTSLAEALSKLPRDGQVSDYAGAAAVTVVCSAGLLWLALIGSERREL